MQVQHPFRPTLFRFLKDLAANNEREWFQAHKADYEDFVRGPALEFVAACAPRLERLSRHIVADPRPVGGSLFRIHRDVRFAKDKRPYKTSAGIHFRHEAGKGAHAPGYYLHLEPGNVFVGLGIWHPDATAARAIRTAIAEDAAGWKRAARAKPLTEVFALEGEALARPPAGFDKQHPLIEDLKRKDFIAVTRLPQSEVTKPDFDRRFVELVKRGTPLMRFLCGALELPF